ncbi:MAG TPA: hypothetical protein VG935_05235 [Patescibacteria group bacterium]|nr:hypothetical protein [Patescibacteria group bacterium]
MDATRQSTKTSKNLKKLSIPVAVVIIILILLAVFSLRKSHQTTTSATASNSLEKVSLPGPKASETVNKNYDFSLRDANGKQVSTFKYIIDSVEKRDEIIVQGKRDVAISGKTFLIVNLRIVNSYNKTIQINSRDYIRLSMNNTSDKIAADIHNDPVEVQPQSTKVTRLGFPISDSDKNLTLYVGELNGKKDTIKLNLH